MIDGQDATPVFGVGSQSQSQSQSQACPAHPSSTNTLRSTARPTPPHAQLHRARRRRWWRLLALGVWRQRLRAPKKRERSSKPHSQHQAMAAAGAVAAAEAELLASADFVPRNIFITGGAGFIASHVWYVHIESGWCSRYIS